MFSIRPFSSHRKDAELTLYESDLRNTCTFIGYKGVRKTYISVETKGSGQNATHYDDTCRVGFQLVLPYIHVYTYIHSLFISYVNLLI